jgi:hypothetical protein
LPEIKSQPGFQWPPGFILHRIRFSKQRGIIRMNKHLGDDHSRLTHFHIVAIDPATSSVVIRYVENEWTRGVDQTQHLPWVEFLNGLQEGRYEIQRTS